MQEEMVLQAKIADQIITEGIEHLKSIEMPTEYVKQKVAEDVLEKLKWYCGFTTKFAKAILRKNDYFEKLI